MTGALRSQINVGDEEGVGGDFGDGVGGALFLDGGEHGGFGGAEDVDGDGGGGVDEGVGEGHAGGIFLEDGVCGDEVVCDGEGRSVREEGGGVAVVAHPEHDEVKGAV